MEYDPVYEANKHSFDMEFQRTMAAEGDHYSVHLAEKGSRRLWRNIATIVIFYLVMRYL